MYRGDQRNGGSESQYPDLTETGFHSTRATMKRHVLMRVLGALEWERYYANLQGHIAQVYATLKGTR